MHWTYYAVINAGVLGLSQATSSIEVNSTVADIGISDDTLTATPYAQVSYELGVSVISDDPRWGGLSSLLVSTDLLSFLALTDNDTLVSGRFLYTDSFLSGVESPVNVQGLNDPSTGIPLDIEAITAISGSYISDPLRDGLYVMPREASISVFLYPPVEEGVYAGVAFDQTPSDALTLCPSIQALMGQCPDNVQRMTSIPAQGAESLGSIVFVCQIPFDDGLLHGWTCNPSTGDTSTFLVRMGDETSFADMAYCHTCDPGQIFFLMRNVGGFSVESVLISYILDGSTIALSDGDSYYGRMRLFSFSSMAYNMSSLAVMPVGSDSSHMRVYIAGSADEDKTVILTFNLHLLPVGTGLISMAGGDSDGEWESFIVLLTLLLIGVALPVVIYRNPKLRSIIDEYKWKKQSHLLGLDDDDDDFVIKPPRVNKTSSSPTIEPTPMQTQTTNPSDMKGNVRLDPLIE